MSQKLLFMAALTCAQFATFKRPMELVAIVAMSHDEALGKAINLARSKWRGDRYSDHSADVIVVPIALIDQVCRQDET